MNPTPETITCPCGSSFQWTNPGDDAWTRKLACAPDLCPKCQADADAEADARREARHKAEQEEKRAAQLTAMREKLASATPARFRGTNIGHPAFNKEAWRKLKDWHPTDEKPWLGMIGETGTCKSRIAHLIAAAYVESITEPDRRPITFVFTTAFDIGTNVLEQYEKRQDETRSLHDDRTPAQRAKDWLKRLRTTDLLFIDDLGKGRMTPAVASEFFDVIDHRHKENMPVIWTANSTPEVIAANMTLDMAAPFAGRLNDCSRIIRFQ